MQQKRSSRKTSQPIGLRHNDSKDGTLATKTMSPVVSTINPVTPSSPSSAGEHKYPLVSLKQAPHQWPKTSCTLNDSTTKVLTTCGAPFVVAFGKQSRQPKHIAHSGPYLTTNEGMECELHTIYCTSNCQAAAP
eukprot:5663093-Amphidinium_carterae.1